MVWQSNITTEEANEIIITMGESVVKSIAGRVVVESQLFPVTTYIGVACYQLYDQSFQYNIVKNMVDHGCDPREIGPKCKTLCAPLNALAFHTFAMNYLHGRAQCLYDRNEAKKQDPNIVVEPEEKKEQTRFLLDFFRYLNPTYRNDGLLLVDQSEDENIRILDKNLIGKLRQDIIEPSKARIKQIKRTIATITSYNFQNSCECRAGTFEHGPYKLETGELLLFREFQFLYTGKPLYPGRKTLFEWTQTEATSPIPNLAIGYILKDMKSVKFNDWGTMFADPPDVSENITGIGIWTREELPPVEQRYPDKLGRIDPVSWETFEKVGKYAQAALTELYLKMAEWDYNRRCLAGVNLYTNWLALFTAYAGTFEEYNWEIPKKTLTYIPIFEKYPMNVHPFAPRFARSKKKRAADPPYYRL